MHASISKANPGNKSHIPGPNSQPRHFYKSQCVYAPETDEIARNENLKVLSAPNTRRISALGLSIGSCAPQEAWDKKLKKNAQMHLIPRRSDRGEHRVSRSSSSDRRRRVYKKCQRWRSATGGTHGQQLGVRSRDLIIGG